MGAAALHALGRGGEIAVRFAAREAAPRLQEILDRGLRCPETSSMGRYFDAAAALLGVAETSRYEAEAALRLEALASVGAPGQALQGAWRLHEGILDLLPLLAVMADWRAAPALGAAAFHATLAEALGAWIEEALPAHRNSQRRARRRLSVERPAARAAVRRTGACRDRGAAAGQPAANDGAISVGQAWVALCHEED